MDIFFDFLLEHFEYFLLSIVMIFCRMVGKTDKAEKIRLVRDKKINKQRKKCCKEARKLEKDVEKLQKMEGNENGNQSS